MKQGNPYLPYPMRIEEVVTETADRSLKTFKLSFLREEDAAKHSFVAGQFAELSIAGKGEIPIGIASSPTEEGILWFTVQKVGLVTTHLHNMMAGDVMGIRSPLGNWYPWEAMEGKNVAIIGGGCAFSTLRASIVWMLDPANRSKFKKITVVYGARNTGMLLYRDDMAAWSKRDDIDVHITVDALQPGEEGSWKGHVGFVPQVVEEVLVGADNSAQCAESRDDSRSESRARRVREDNDDTETVAVVCGPPAMIKFTRPVLSKAGLSDAQIILSLENRMKCGIGMCGRCNVGEDFVCKDGPVFSLADLKQMPNDL